MNDDRKIESDNGNIIRQETINSKLRKDDAVGGKCMISAIPYIGHEYYTRVALEMLPVSRLTNKYRCTYMRIELRV